MARGFHLGGVVDERQSIYVRRPEDERFLDLVLARSHVLVQGSRQAGKSSLVNHAIPVLEAKGWRFAWVDLAATNPGAGLPAATWCRTFVKELLRSAGHAAEGTRLAAAGVSIIEAVRALAALSTSPLLLVLDEFDSLEMYPALALEVVAQLRVVQQARSRGDDDLSRLVLAACIVKQPPDLLAALDHVRGPKELAGVLLCLEDFRFTEETIDDIAEGFPEGTPAPRDLARHALEFSCGYPVACMWACTTIVVEGWSYSPDLPQRLASAVARAKKEPPTFLQVTDNYVAEHRSAAVESLTTYLRVLGRSEVTFDGQDPAHKLLRWAGLCRVSDDGSLRSRGPMMEAFFDREWTHRRLERFRSTGIRLARHRRSEKRVCILNTGGTIGMVEKPDGSVGPPVSAAELPFDDVDLIADYEAITLFSQDSANVGPAEWTTIAAAIKEREGQFSGFVVAHGTDTLAYSASAVAFALGPRLTFPVVFTGSQATVDIHHGDARPNILRAALVATQQLPEVVVCFGERVLRACRAQKRDDFRFDAFDSPAFPPLGWVAEEVELLEQNFRDKRQPGPIELRAAFADGILQVVQTPGCLAEFYFDALDRTDARGGRKCRGLVVRSLGAGNVPTTDRYSLVPLIERAVGRGIPVALTSEFPMQARNLTRYSPAEAAIRAGAIPTGDMTVAAVVAKLAWVLALVDRQGADLHMSAERRLAEVATLLQRDEVGEVTQIVVGNEQ